MEWWQNRKPVASPAAHATGIFEQVGMRLGLGEDDLYEIFPTEPIQDGLIKFQHNVGALMNAMIDKMEAQHGR